MGTWRSVKCKDKHIAGTNNSQEKHVNVPDSQSAVLGSNLAASGLVEDVTAERLACLEHVTAPRAAARLLTNRPARHTQPAASPSSRMHLQLLDARQDPTAYYLLPMLSHSLDAHINIRNEIKF